MNSQIEMSLLIPAVTIITSALIFYTIGVWAERIQKGLKLWHVLFFIMGILCDIFGTSFMEQIARITRMHDNLHAITGFTAVALMFIHAVWAVYTYFKGSETAKRNFSRFSIIVWLIWLIPYGIGVYIGMSH